MALAKPGRYEYEVEALLREVFRTHGSERPAYGRIVGSGRQRDHPPLPKQHQAHRRRASCS